MESFDVVVLGGGIAGASVAAELATDRRVAVLEMEATLGFHTTGRSAATYLESYGGPAIRALTTASRPFLAAPPFPVDSAILSPLGALHTAAPGRGQVIRDLYRDVSALVPAVQLLDGEAAIGVQPLLRPGAVELALLEPDAMKIDVNALHQGYLRELRRLGGAVVTSAPTRPPQRRAGRWTVADDRGREWSAPVVVDAAGAWADQVAVRFGAEPIGLVPMRRTAFMIDAPAGAGGRDGPMIGDIDDRFYVKPEGGQFLCSPAEETPHEPGDARPDELEIARALDEIGAATTLDTTHVRSSWAGLRSFVADRTPVVGYDAGAEGFFWFAAQGGYGIQTAPALARVGAALVRREPVPADIVRCGLAASALAPGRPGLA